MAHRRYRVPDRAGHLGGRVHGHRCRDDGGAAGEDSVYALCRQPGHHAFRDVAGGFCFLDPLARLAVTTEGFRRVGAAIARMGLPTMLVQEGGYLSDILDTNLTAVLARFESAR